MSETAVQPALAVELPIPDVPKGEAEYQAFLRLLPQLLETHRGKYVAIHHGQVVDSDTDDVALVLRVQAKVGYVPIHVGLVIDPQPVLRIPHYHEWRLPTRS
jgi:hydrogenase maturation factor